MNTPMPETERKLRNLAQDGWLAGEPVAFRDHLARLGHWVSLSKGMSAYSAGDQAVAFFGLGEGILDVAVPLDDAEMVLVHKANPGFWIGDGTLMTGLPRVITITAARDSRIFVVPAPQLQNLLAEYPQAWRSLQRLSAMNSTLLIKVLAEILALPAQQRFARLLLRIAAKDGVITATQEELGRLAGMSRVAFRRAFDAQVMAGILKVEYGRIRILDHKQLEDLAQANGNR